MIGLVATHVFAGASVSDIALSRSWYERLLGRPPDVLPNDREAVWELAEGGLMYIVADSEHAGHAVVTLIVSDLDGALAALGERGFERPPVEVLGGAGRKTTVVDPDGNRIALAQVAQPETD